MILKKLIDTDVKRGTKLVCIVNGGNDWKKNVVGWFGILRQKKSYGPKFNEVVTYLRDHSPGFITLKEYESNGGYDERCFKPLVEDAKLEKELSEVSQLSLN